MIEKKLKTLIIVGTFLTAINTTSANDIYYGENLSQFFAVPISGDGQFAVVDAHLHNWSDISSGTPSSAHDLTSYIDGRISAAGTGTGGIADAPSDGVDYVRQDGAWVSNWSNADINALIDAKITTALADGGSVETAIKNNLTAFDLLPSGFTYVQFPNAGNPWDVVGGASSDWNCNWGANNMGGSFFRVEGGSGSNVAASFGSFQGEGARNLTGKFGNSAYFPASDAWGSIYAPGVSISGAFGVVDSTLYIGRFEGELSGTLSRDVVLNAANQWGAAITNANEFRPYNYTVKICRKN